MPREGAENPPCPEGAEEERGDFCTEGAEEVEGVAVRVTLPRDCVETPGVELPRCICLLLSTRCEAGRYVVPPFPCEEPPWRLVVPPAVPVLPRPGREMVPLLVVVPRPGREVEAFPLLLPPLLLPLLPVHGRKEPLFEFPLPFCALALLLVLRPPRVVLPKLPGACPPRLPVLARGVPLL